MPRDIHQNFNDKAEPIESAVIPEFGNVSIRASQPERRSGRVVATERQRGTRYPQAEDFGYKAPVYPKRQEITLAGIKSDLETVYTELTAAESEYNINKNVPDTHEADLRSDISVLEQQLANRRTELEKVIAEGTVAQRAAKAISKAECSTAALASHTIDCGAAQDALATFKAQIKLLPGDTRKALAVRHTQALRELLANSLIKTSGTENLTDAQIAAAFERILTGVNKLGEYLTSIEQQEAK